MPRTVTPTLSRPPTLAIARRCLGNLAVHQDLDRLHHPVVLEPAWVMSLLRERGDR